MFNLFNLVQSRFDYIGLLSWIGVAVILRVCFDDFKGLKGFKAIFFTICFIPTFSSVLSAVSPVCAS